CGDPAAHLTGHRALPHVRDRVDGEGPDQSEVDVQDPLTGELDEEVLAVCARLHHLEAVEQPGAGGEAALRGGDGHGPAGEGGVQTGRDAVQRVSLGHGEGGLSSPSSSWSTSWRPTSWPSTSWCPPSPRTTSSTRPWTRTASTRSTSSRQPSSRPWRPPSPWPGPRHGPPWPCPPSGTGPPAGRRPRRSPPRSRPGRSPRPLRPWRARP